MSAIVPVEHGQGHGGKKGMGKNGKILLYGGGLALIGALLVFKRSAPQQEQQQDLPLVNTNYPTLAPSDAGLWQDTINTMIGQQQEFIKSMTEAMNKKTEAPAPPPAAPPAPAPSPAPAPIPPPQAAPQREQAPGWVDPYSIVDHLKWKGRASDYDSRARLASEMGISNYRGSASQNTQMLRQIRGY